MDTHGATDVFDFFFLQWVKTFSVILHIYQVENWDVLLNLHLYFMY